jgi:hypothetical protein
MAEGMAMLTSLTKQQAVGAYFPRLVDRILDWFFEHPEFDDLKPQAGMMVHEEVVKLGVPLPVPQDLREIRAMLLKVERLWLAEVMAKRRAAGRADCLRQDWAHMLYGILVMKFGRLEPSLCLQINEADLPSIECWLHRTTGARDLPSVFDSPP